jgi:hypothetical protein
MMGQGIVGFRAFLRNASRRKSDGERDWWATSCPPYYAGNDGKSSGELALKEWKREWKIKLIEKGNPLWQDLWDATMKNG